MGWFIRRSANQLRCAGFSVHFDMRYFKKILASQPVKCLGSLVAFESVGGNVGVRKLDENTEAPLIAELDNLADHRLGGVVKISAEIFEGLKKNPLPPPVSRNRTGVLSSLRVFNPEATVPKLRPPSPKSAVAAPAVAAPSVASPGVKIFLPPPPSNQRPSHAPGFTLSKQKRSEVEAKAKSSIAP